jgi:hypothetical protein
MILFFTFHWLQFTYYVFTPSRRGVEYTVSLFPSQQCDADKDLSPVTKKKVRVELEKVLTVLHITLDQ